MGRLRKRFSLRDHVPRTCISEASLHVSAKCPSNPHRRRCAFILICCEFIFRLDANLPWNELFILRCFPVQSVLAYGELHVEKLLCHRSSRVRVFIDGSASVKYQTSLYPPSLYGSRLFSPFSFPYFIFVPSIPSIRAPGSVDGKRDCCLKFETRCSGRRWKEVRIFLAFFFSSVNSDLRRRN